DVEVHAPRPRTVEHEAAVHLEEREVRAHEDRVVRRVLHFDLDGASVAVDQDGAFPEQDLAGLHPAPSREPAFAAARIGYSTWRPRIPSPKTHSIFTGPRSSVTSS